jgi:hypothetical protein
MTPGRSMPLMPPPPPLPPCDSCNSNICGKITSNNYTINEVTTTSSSSSESYSYSYGDDVRPSTSSSSSSSSPGTGEEAVAAATAAAAPPPTFHIEQLFPQDHAAAAAAAVVVPLVNDTFLDPHVVKVSLWRCLQLRNFSTIFFFLTTAQPIPRLFLCVGPSQTSTTSRRPPPVWGPRGVGRQAQTQLHVDWKGKLQQQTTDPFHRVVADALLGTGPSVRCHRGGRDPGRHIEGGRILPHQSDIDTTPTSLS